MSSQSQESPKPVKLRKFARQKPKRNLGSANQILNGSLTPNGNPIPDLNNSGEIQNRENRSENYANGNEQDQTQRNENESDANLNQLYTNIKSIPNYSAKLAEFLRQNDVHSKHRRVVKKKFPRRHIIVHFRFKFLWVI